jgi:hypothetical protein
MNLEHWQPAFPCSLKIDGEEEITHFGGLTLLDYFAAKAMAGLLSQHTTTLMTQSLSETHPAYMGWHSEEHLSIAKTAFEIAQAMVVVRDELFVNQTAIE